MELNMTTTGTLNPDGSLTNVRTIRQSSFAECPFCILMPNHYRHDESCKCDDPEHRKLMIKEWEYTEEDFANIPLRGSVPVEGEVIKDRYEARILALMNKLKDALKEAGLVATEPFDLSGDSYMWSLDVTDRKPAPADQLTLTVGGESIVEDDHRSIDVQFEIVESEEYDGVENGVNFALNVTRWGGQIVGGLTPYNYSDGVWVDRANEAQVERRFKILEDADPASLVELIQHDFEEWDE